MGWIEILAFQSPLSRGTPPDEDHLSSQKMTERFNPL